MGATGRKLMIRMPDNPRLRSAEVGKVHLDPGARVQSGNPVLTLLNRRKEHLVRAPRSGRIVPLIAPGDRVSGGDPLYILHIDENALEQKQRADRAMIAVEREKWTSGVLADAIEPIRRNKSEVEESRISVLVANWGKPVLALALYVLACFAFLPILHFFGQSATTPVLIAMVLACIAFAVLILYLYAPQAGRWPRWSVRMVALSWLGISCAALFYRPDNPDDISIGNAIGPVASLFAPSEETTPLAPPPEAAPTPVAVAQSGVAVGPTEQVSSPTQSEPVTVLAAFNEQITPHGVRVRPWERVTPSNNSGDALVFNQADQSVTLLWVSDPILLATLEADTVDLVPELPDGLRTSPKRAERSDDIVVAAIPQVRDTDLPAAPTAWGHALRDENVVSIAAFADRAGIGTGQLALAVEASTDTTLAYGDAQTMQTGPLAILQGAQTDAIAQPLQLAAIPDFATRLSSTADRETILAKPGQGLSPGLNLASKLRSGDADWVDNQISALRDPSVSFERSAASPETSLVVMRGEVRPTAQSTPSAVETLPMQPANEGEIILGDVALRTPDSKPLSIALDVTSDTAQILVQPERVASSRSPGLMLISALRAGESNWMQDQTQILASGTEVRLDTQDPLITVQSPVKLASLDAGQIGAIPGVTALSERIGTAKDFAMARLPVLDGEPRPPEVRAEEPAGIVVARLNPLTVANLPSSIGRTTVPQAAPNAPPLQPEQVLVNRDLLYLYFDDPRLLTHPQIGDPWEGLVSPELSAAIQRTEVIEVHEMLQVQNWCAAANDPDGSKRAALGAAYTTAVINDRVRLLRVRLSVEDAALERLEAEIPLFDGSPAGLFHNKAPLLAGLPEDGLMQKGRDYLRSLSAGIFDPNAPDAIGGGQYFDNAVAVSVILRGAGCDQVSLNDGDGPANGIGRTLSAQLGG